ncbi:hypothetical protein F5Y04DRAFT_278062 [Hypomontagnella monticulosa]|nr:hypothetical protein F5Y04DRAFT_278062 [Hypomontagnella monticulosa]
MATNRVNQTGNIGIIQGIHYGDNVSYGETKLTPKHVALEKHKEVKEKWEVSGTCDWILETEEFQSWERTGTEPSFLWLHGRPGAGKSTLMYVPYHREHLHDPICAERLHSSTLLLCWPRRRAREDKLYRRMLVTFWQQATNRADDRFMNTSGNLPETIEKPLLELLVSSKRDIYIVVDALDQLPTDSQYRLTRWLNTLVDAFKAQVGSGRLNVAISSRDSDDIKQIQTRQVYQIEVTAESNKYDIKRYIERNLESTLLKRQPELAEQVYRKLYEKADGMFLWVSLQVLNICNIRIGSQIEEALKSLVPPQRLQDMYKAYADAFESSGDRIQQQIAQRIIPLLTYNAGSMSKEAVLIALSLDATGRVNMKLREDLSQNLTMISRFSNHLVRINDSLGIFQFCHGTAFEFFRNYEAVASSHRIAMLCLSHLCSPELSWGTLDGATWYSLGPVLQQHPFLLFACSEWAPSIKRSSTSASEIQLQECCSEVRNWLRILFDKDDKKGNLRRAFQIYLLSLGKKASVGVSHEHIVCYFSLIGLMDALKEWGWFDPEKPDDDGLRPIHWAIRNDTNLDDAALAVQKLIDFGIDVDAKDKEGRSPLYYAAYYGNLRVAKLLIDKKAKLNVTNQDGETALVAACKKHHEEVVLYLIKKGANVKLRSSFGTALQAISLVGCCRCAEAILGPYKNCRIAEKGGPFGTSLHTAAYHGHSDLVKLLCTKRINIHETHSTYGSPITAAVSSYNSVVDPAPFIDIVTELITHGVNVNDRSGRAGPALRAAAYYGSSDLVRLLLDKGADIKVKGQMGTAYEAAEDCGHQEIKEILLSYDAKAAEYGGSRGTKENGRQAIQRWVFRAAVKTSNMETIDRLIAQFEELVEKEIRKGETPFLRGLAGLGRDCFQETIELTTKSRDNINTPTWSREKGYERILRQLRSTTSDICCIKLADRRPHPHPTFELTPRFTFAQDSLQDHFPKVLDRLTQAAVKVMDDAIATKDRNLIRLIAKTWVEALNNLVSYDGFGESMLETVVKRRADNLKGYLIDPDLSHEERIEKAEGLALVGIELLLIAIEQGPKFKHLAVIISKLWVNALIDVEDLGKEAEKLVVELIRIFGIPFSNAIRDGDQVNAEHCARASIALQKAAALSQKKGLLEKFSKEFAVQWDLALENNMEPMAKKLFDQQLEEHQQLRKDGGRVEALGLALVGISLLRAFIQCGDERLIGMLRRSIESGFRLVQESYSRHDTSTELPTFQYKDISARDLEVVSRGLIDLFATTEEVRPGYLTSFASQVLGFAEAIFGDDYRQLERIITRHIDEADQIVGGPKREEQLIQISSAIFLFLDLVLSSRKMSPAVLSTLKNVSLGALAKALPDFLDRDELVRYEKSIVYLKSESRKMIPVGETRHIQSGSR